MLLGVYFLAAQLDLFSTELLAMSTGADISAFFAEVAGSGGENEWFRRLQSKGQNYDLKELTWSSFVNGWIHCTAG